MLRWFRTEKNMLLEWTLPPLCSGWSCSSNLATTRERPRESRRLQPRCHSASGLTLAARYLRVLCYRTEINPDLFKLL